MNLNKPLTIVAILILAGTGLRSARCHTQMQFTIMDVKRELVCSADKVLMKYDCTFLPQALQQPPPFLDLNTDGKVDGPEKDDFHSSAAEYLKLDLIVFIDKDMTQAKQLQFNKKPDGNGFTAAYEAPLPSTGAVQKDEVVTVIDPAFLFPSIAGDSATSSTAVRASEGVQLVSPDAKTEPMLTVESAASTSFMVRRKPGAVAARDNSTTPSAE